MPGFFLSQIKSNEKDVGGVDIDNRKIFTILPSTELLRLYDNVPIKALGQTLMGNRLVYGNYVEGYDLKDIFNNPVKLEFQANLIRGALSNTNLLVAYLASFK